MYLRTPGGWPWSRFFLRFTKFVFPHKVGIRKTQRAYRQVRAAGVGGPRQGFPCSLLPGVLSNRGPQPAEPALVFRTEDD